METTTIIVMGLSVNIDYQFHEGNYVEWRVSQVTTDTVKYSVVENQRMLLEYLLRHHHTAFIEATLREFHFHKSYAESQQRDWNLFEEEDVPF